MYICAQNYFFLLIFMSEEPILRKHTRDSWLSYPGQFGLLLSLFGGGVVLLAILMLGFTLLLGGNIDDAVNYFSMEDMQPATLRILQIFGSVLQFGLPALLLAIILRKRIADFFYLNRKSSSKIVFLVVLLCIFGLAFSDLLTKINHMIPVSAEAYQRYLQTEEAYMRQIFKIVDFSTVGYIALSFFILAVLPGFFEELLFRGALQPILIGWAKSPFWGIFITAVLFSMMHLSFFGFLPRVFLGMALGYIFYYSKNLWMSILFHFLNNAFAVGSFYFYSRKGTLDYAKATENMPFFISITGTIVFLVVFYMFYKQSLAEKSLATG